MATDSAAEARREDYRSKGWWDGRTLHGVFDAARAAHPERFALVDPPDTDALIGRDPLRLDYEAVGVMADNLALALDREGIQRGDAVLAQLPNTAELAILYLALSRLGVVLSPVPMQYGRHELADACKQLKPRAFLTVGAFKGEAFAGPRDEAIPDGVRRFAFGDEASGYGAMTLDASAPAVRPHAAGQPEDILTVCWTSGTTGTPKGVPRHHGHWFAQTIAVQDAVPLGEPAAMLNPFPLTNMAALSGFLFFWPQNGGTLVLHHPFDLPTYLRQIAEEAVQYTIAPPAVLNIFMKTEALHKQADLSRVRYIASGSAPLDPWMVRGFKDKFGIEVINFFGSNEGVGLVGGPLEVPDPERRAAVFPRFGVSEFTWTNRFGSRCETKLVDWRDGDRVITRPGESGELLIRGPNVFDGYLNRAAQDEVFDQDGFFRTGDLFQIAGDGEEAAYYRFVGRRKALIIRGGMNISPEELDMILSAHPAILECAVCAYEDAMMGEKVCLVATPKPGASLDLESVKAFLEAEGVAKFKWPERLAFAESLPRNALGKVMRDRLMDVAVEADASSAAAQ